MVGPYSNVSGTPTVLRSTVRHSGDATPGYGRPERAEDPRFTDYFSAAESVVTSSANADSGLFETQLRDERFLPFEGARGREPVMPGIRTMGGSSSSEEMPAPQ